MLALAFALLLVPSCAGEAVTVGATEAAGDACGVAVGSSGCDCRTERVPVNAGSESSSAISMKEMAAPIVTLARMVCVPRGPNAVLETLLEKSAPASALPGCKSTAMTNTMQDKINSPYKT